MVNVRTSSTGVLVPGDSPLPEPRSWTFAERVWFALAAGAGLAVVGLLVVFAINALLVIFFGILLAIVLERLTRMVRRLGLSHAVAFPIVLLGLAALIGLSAWFLGARITGRVDQLVEQLQVAWQSSKQWLGQSGWGRAALESVPSLQQLFSGGWSSLSGLNVLFTTVSGMFATTFIIVCLGIYFAVEPGLYRRAFLHLVPKAGRKRADEVVHAVTETLWFWCVGRAASMAIIGVGASIGLWLLGVPLPATLGILAGLLSFIPNLGGFLGVVAPALLALQQGPMTVVWVLALFAGLQLIETNLLTPLIEKNQTSLPPGLILGGQLLMGALTGLLGLALATPLLAAIVVIIREVYVVDLLDDRTAHAPESINPEVVHAEPA